MMNSEVSQIDRIVREVMRRLEQVPASGATSPHGAARDPIDDATLRVDERVVTGDVLSGRLTGVGRIQVRQDAIVTPLVKDLLKEKNVKLQRVPRRPSVAARRWLMVEPGRCRPEPLLAQLTKIDAQWTLTDDWQQLLDSVAAGDAAVVVTPAWATRVCQANRCQTVRAVHVLDESAVQQALEQVQANMLVINAEQSDETAVAQIAREFVELALREEPLTESLRDSVG